MLCLCFGLVFLNLIILATVIPIAKIYIYGEFRNEYWDSILLETFECAWSALCPDETPCYRKYVK